MKIVPITKSPVYRGQVKVKNITQPQELLNSQLSQNTNKTSFFKSIVNKFKQIFEQNQKSAENYKTPQLKPIFEGSKLNPGKVQNTKIFELENIIYNPILVEEFFKAYPDIDINSFDEKGRTLYLRAVNRNDVKFINKLIELHRNRKYGEVDWDAVDKNGDNALFIDYNNANHNYLQCLLLDWTNPNYIHTKTKRTISQEAIINGDNDYLYYLLYSRRLDINVSHPDTPPAYFMAFNNKINRINLEKIFSRKNPNLETKYKGQTIYDYIKWGNCNIPSKEVFFILEKHLLEKNLKATKEYYEKEGELSLQQLFNYTNQHSFKEICNQPLNDIGETVGHFIAEIHPKNFDEIKIISDIIDRLKLCGFKFFAKDIINRCPAEKAIEANNIVVLKLLLQVMSSSDDCYFMGENPILKNWERIEKSD